MSMTSLDLSWHAVHRMIDATRRRPVFAAVWSARLALFSGGLAIVGILLHRLLGLPTPILLNVLKVAFAGAALALVLGLMGAVQVWFTGRTGAGAATAGLLAGLLLFAWPAYYYPAMRDLPAINDVTTDPDAPPPMMALAKLRGPGANPVAYPGERFAELQAAAYPDLKPFLIPRPADEAFEIAAEAVRQLRYKVVSETPPGESFEEPGYIEAVERTFVMGFYDDIVIRVMGDSEASQIDIRSASRYGTHDLGQNASRIRTILAELRKVMDSTVPAEANPRNARSKQKATQQKRGGRGRAGRRN
jgi:hypothetical protein